jgi:hypothetical protein
MKSDVSIRAVCLEIGLESHEHVLPCMLGMVTSSHKTVSYSLKVPRTYYYK